MLAKGSLIYFFSNASNQVWIESIHTCLGCRCNVDLRRESPSGYLLFDRGAVGGREERHDLSKSCIRTLVSPYPSHIHTFHYISTRLASSFTMGAPSNCKSQRENSSSSLIMPPCGHGVYSTVNNASQSTNPNHLSAIYLPTHLPTTITPEQTLRSLRCGCLATSDRIRASRYATAARK